MAGYMCDSDDGQPADFLITNLGNGDTMAFCSACLPAFALTLIEALSGQASPDGSEAAETAATAEEEGEATPSTPAPKRGQRQAQAAQAAPAQPTPADPLPGID